MNPESQNCESLTSKSRFRFPYTTTNESKMQEPVRKILKKEQKCRKSVIICSDHCGVFHKMTEPYHKNRQNRKKHRRISYGGALIAV
jgi:hypothetical protein